jgi:hypothetical protein
VREVEHGELAVEQRVGEPAGLAQPRQHRVGLAPREQLAHGGIEPRALLLVARLARGVREPERVVVLELERLQLGDEALDEVGELALARAGDGVGRGHG